MKATSSPLSVLRQGLDRAKAAYWLRDANSCGEGVSLSGRPFIANTGSLSLGKDVFISSRPVQSHLVATGDAILELGDRVSISYGAAISAQREVRIGADTRIGPFVVIMDSDFHVVGDRNAHSEPSPVRIGKGVVIESHVTIMRGTTLGDGVRVRSGSVVSGSAPAGAVLAGVPARAVADEATHSHGIELPELVKRVLNLAQLPSPSDGPDQIPEWDSMGSLKLLLSLEKTFGVTIREDLLKSAQSVARLAEIVEAARATS